MTSTPTTNPGTKMLHPIRLSTAEVLAYICAGMKQRGYTVGAPPEFIIRVEQNGDQRMPDHYGVLDGATVMIEVVPVPPKSP